MTTHVLSFPPHPDGFYVSSALCSCGRYQYDIDSEEPEVILAARVDVQQDWEQHVRDARPEADIALVYRAWRSAEEDLLWALHVISRLGWPGSIADLFTICGQPSLIEEYQIVQKNIEGRKKLAEEDGA